VGFNWGYLLQQALAAVLALALAIGVVASLRLLPTLRARRAARILAELPAGAGVLAIAGVVIAASPLAPMLPGRVLGVFLAIGLAFYWICVWWPLRVFWVRRDLGDDVPASAARGLAAVLPLIAGYACFVEPRWLDVTRCEVRVRGPLARAIKVAHVSDLQLIHHSARDDAAVAAINAFDPDLVICTGDYVTARVGDDAAIAAARAFFGALRSRHGVFATIGDSDSWEQRQRIFDGLPVHYLFNKSAAVDVDGTRVRVGCLNHFTPQWSRLGGGPPGDELFVVACHVPDLAEECARRLPDADLFLCGHTHGGQLQIPGFGPLVTFSDVPRHVAAGGVFTAASGLPYVVSRGIGMEGNYAPRFRLFCRPQVLLLTLVERPASEGTAR
jgi:predicted MPP superfamily phosphohydrolase